MPISVKTVIAFSVQNVLKVLELLLFVKSKNDDFIFYLICQVGLEGDRWDVRLELFRQFKKELVRLLEGLVFEEKKYSNESERGIISIHRPNLT
jgi:hypothetical protein